MPYGAGKTFVLTALLEQILDKNTKILIVVESKATEYFIRDFFNKQLSQSKQIPFPSPHTNIMPTQLYIYAAPTALHYLPVYFIYWIFLILPTPTKARKACL